MVDNPKDRFLSKRNRCRRASSFLEEREEISIVRGFNARTYAQVELLRLEYCVAHPLYEARNDWVDATLKKLRSGFVDKLDRLRINGLLFRLESGVFIGPIQRKQKLMSERTRQWRANASAFESMTAARPLKPPGRK